MGPFFEGESNLIQKIMVPKKNIHELKKGWLVGNQLDDSPKLYEWEMVGNHHFHPLKNGCLGFQEFMIILRDFLYE